MNRQDALKQTGVVAATVAIVAGAAWLAGATGGSTPAAEPARPSPSATSTAAPTAAAQGTATGLPQGKVEAARGASGDINKFLAGSSPRTIDGAVEGFIDSAQWMLASPAVAADPANALPVISEVLNVTDREMLRGFDRKGGVVFSPTAGAYRVLGHAGDEARPDKVMVEVVAPLEVAGNQRWIVIGGVVSFVDGRWQVESIRPTTPSQPDAGARSVNEMAEQDRSKVLKGLGWKSFANADG